MENNDRAIIVYSNFGDYYEEFSTIKSAVKHLFKGVKTKGNIINHICAGRRKNKYLEHPEFGNLTFKYKE